MTTITCDTSLDDNGEIHCVVIIPSNLPRLIADVWAGVDIGSTITLIDEVTGDESTGTLTAFETSYQCGPLGATRVELTITPD